MNESPYETFAPWYAAWTGSAPITEANRRFYVDTYLRTEGPVVELGIGDGRIAVEAALRGKDVIGVDDSPRMLELCRRRALEAGVQDRLTLIEADFRRFTLPEPAALVSLPFHSMGHLVTPEQRVACLKHVLDSLVPGGHFVFDHFIADPDIIRSLDRQTILRSVFRHPETGRRTLLWGTTVYDVPARRMKVYPAAEELDDDGHVVSKQVVELDFSWVDPEEMRQEIRQAGFDVEAVFGDFQRNAFDADSGHQIWSLQRPVRPI